MSFVPVSTRVRLDKKSEFHRQSTRKVPAKRRRLRARETFARSLPNAREGKPAVLLIGNCSILDAANSLSSTNVYLGVRLGATPEDSDDE